ncbi:MAG TPA: hypothetical protein VKA68_18395 [bacterium]|nr:hypothetical protein [bacterium]
MQWDFTPQQVLTGEAAYDIRDYRDDLWEEMQEHADQKGFEGFFWTMYHLAMGYSPKQMTDMIRKKNALSQEEAKEQLQQFELIAASHENEIDMLKAIIKRKLLQFKQEGRDIYQEETLVEYMREWVEDTVQSHQVD